MSHATNLCTFWETCYELGRHYSRLSADSNSLDWDEPVDLEKARMAYERGCLSGEGESCRALVEQGLSKDAAQVERFERRARYYGKPPRDPEALATERAEIAREAAEDNERINERRAHEAQAAAEQREAIKNMLTSAGKQVAEQWQPGGGKAQGSAGGESKPGRKQTGVDCSPCSKDYLKPCSSDPLSKACYCGAEQMHRCVAKHCSTDQKASQAAIADMHKGCMGK